MAQYAYAAHPWQYDGKFEQSAPDGGGGVDDDIEGGGGELVHEEPEGTQGNTWHHHDGSTFHRLLVVT